MKQNLQFAALYALGMVILFDKKGADYAIDSALVGMFLVSFMLAVVGLVVKSKR